MTCVLVVFDRIHAHSNSKGGLVSYQAASEEWDVAIQDQLAEFTDALAESQDRMKTLFTELKEMEERRQEWWMRIAQMIDDAGLYLSLFHASPAESAN